METFKCSKCEKEYDRDNFHTIRNKNGEKIRIHQCKPCANLKMRIYRNKNKEKTHKQEKARRERNKGRLKTLRDNFLKENPQTTFECSKCKKELHWTSFWKSSGKIRPILNKCKSCMTNVSENEKNILRERAKRGYQKHKQKRAESTKKYRELNKDKFREYKRNYYQKNKLKITQQNKEYKNKNKERCREYVKEWSRERRKNSLHMRIIDRLRTRLYYIFKKNYLSKEQSTLDLCGCDIDFLIKYIESLFLKNMTWEKFASGEIHIDHIKPVCSFDLSHPDQQKECFHYSNLQPLWAIDNLKKSAEDKKQSIHNKK